MIGATVISYVDELLLQKDGAVSRKSPLTPRSDAKAVSPKSSGQDIDEFLEKASELVKRAGTNGKLIFAMDATMSRQPTWDLAVNLQAEMFLEAARAGGLEVQLVYFRGFRECKASRWTNNANSLAELMSKIDCRGGHTQIGKVLSHIKKEASKGAVDAAVYVGDCMEEDVDQLCAKAGEIGLMGIPVFMFQEGQDLIAGPAFREIARLTGGAYERFDQMAVARLRELLKAVAIYASGGKTALIDYAQKEKGARALLEQIK